MIAFTTQVHVDELPFRLDFASGIVSLGSCFSDEIGQRLRNGGFHIEANPFGTLYNPASIANALQRLMHDSEIDMSDLVEYEGLWHSWHHHGRFSQPTAEACLEACNSRIHLAHKALKEAQLLMITFGSAWVFELKSEVGGRKSESEQDTSALRPPTSNLQVVANCHKLPQENFVRHRMSIDDIVTLWQPLLDELHAYYPSLHILFSVSPIRHIGDGLHGNQLSKSTLLLAIDQLQTTNSQLPIYYFPSYELVLDELRDYRFFDTDMVHPSSLAVDFVWEHFQRATMVPAIRDQAHLNAKQARRNHHIPLHPTLQNTN